MEMGTRSDLRGFLKQSHKTSKADATSPSSYLNEIGGRNSRKEPAAGGDELVKYMSKLPAYLQVDESSLHLQSNVLNVGVLDWSRLEQWKKHGRRGERSGKCERKVSSSSLGTVPNASLHRCKIENDDDQVHACSNLRIVKAASRDLQHSLHGTGCTLDPEPELPSSLNYKQEEIATTCSYKSSEDMKLPLLGGADLSAKKEPCGEKARQSKTTASMIFDQEKKRPSKRFSFSFGRRLSRPSFTFKEDSSSAIINKSDSMRFDGPSQSQYSHGGSRVGPLRRLLDHPLLKPKVSETVLPSKARSSSLNLDEEKKKQDASRTGALFQLTIRNGTPLFQFVVDDDDNNKSRRRRSILGATMKTPASSFKDDSVQYCTFYSVAKKKSRSWMIHGHKDRFVYNVIGEMRLCNSEQKSENMSSVIIRESVLEVDESEEQRKEVAAVVIQKKKKKHMEENFTTVIIPGGVHSIPEKGAPTPPLISRWRSGGCCDCGGWDVGCKLHVLLSNKTFLLHDLVDQTFKLFDHHQEESDKNSGSVFAMTELKTGIYRVEFGSFLSHLQAFFVCVTVITCASDKEETVSKTTGKTSSPFAPPLSPVGRA